ncbi:hypothetical protein Halxa_2486 [Halopiger xanaduensis SH-6]|uniref:Uncharacterized protein n=1 Tax=Halopiger xanaduensis (strain DSM 18323 / JCM 14033 / SH-6) TaxID=797210 RepID=F8DBI4_HALXS|nr:hypothetical protein Halxa_2486 [Halopiger xanaduensis SH-6]
MRNVTRKPDSTSTSTSLESDAARSAASTDRLERRGAVDASDGDASATAGEEAADGPLELAAAADQCRTCGATIGPRERRLSWVVETATATLEAHYCSETCLPDEPPTGSQSSAAETDAQQAPRDWSYCR